MALESANYINDLVITNPVGATDDRSTSDDHHRLQKKAAKNSFPGHTGVVSAKGAVSGTNAYAMSITISGATLTYTDGMMVTGVVTNANTTTNPTLNINSVGAKTIYKQGGTALYAGDMPAAGRCVFIFDSNLDGWILLNPVQSPINFLKLVYPVGSIYMSAVATNPATLLGFGTWVAEAAGRVLVGVGTSDASYALGATGGESTHVLSLAEMPAHNHGGGNHTHTIPNNSGGGSTGALENRDPIGTRATGASGTIISAQGGGGAHNNMPPYKVVHIWRRTA